jgi:hypothetical protein
MYDIYVKIEWLCREPELIGFETADQAYEFAQAKSKERGVNYCRVYIWGFEQYSFDCGILIK